MTPESSTLLPKQARVHVDISKIKEKPEGISLSTETAMIILSNKTTLSKILNKTLREFNQDHGRSKIYLKEDELCNFKTTEKILPILEKHVFEALRVLENYKEVKGGEKTSTDDIAAWTIDNFRKTKHEARSILLKASCTASPPKINSSEEITVLAKSMFDSKVYELPTAKKNTEADYNKLRKDIEHLYDAVPTLHLIKHFNAYSENEIDDAVRYFGPEYIRALSEANFWKTFETGKDLADYIDGNYSTISGKVNHGTALRVVHIQEPIFKQLFKALGEDLLFWLQMDKNTGDTQMTPEFTLPVILSEIGNFHAEKKEDRLIIRSQTLKAVAPYVGSGDNSAFIEWAMKIIKYINDPTIAELDSGEFADIRAAFSDNISNNEFLASFMDNHPIVDYESFRFFLKRFISWVAEKLPRKPTKPLDNQVSDINSVAHVTKKRQFSSGPQTEQLNTATGQKKVRKDGKASFINESVWESVNDQHRSTVSKIMCSKNILAQTIKEDSRTLCCICLSVGHHSDLRKYTHPITDCELATAIGVNSKSDAEDICRNGNLIIKLKKKLGILSLRTEKTSKSDNQSKK